MRFLPSALASLCLLSFSLASAHATPTTFAFTGVTLTQGTVTGTVTGTIDVDTLQRTVVGNNFVVSVGATSYTFSYTRTAGNLLVGPHANSITYQFYDDGQYGPNGTNHLFNLTLPIYTQGFIFDGTTLCPFGGTCISTFGPAYTSFVPSFNNFYYDATGTLQLAATPEPSSLVFLGTGVAMLLSFSRRRLPSAK